MLSLVGETFHYEYYFQFGALFYYLRTTRSTTDHCTTCTTLSSRANEVERGNEIKFST